MGITQEVFNRIVALHDEIESRKTHGHAAPTYRDRPALIELEEILSRMVGDDRETIENRMVVTAYLATAYDAMGRFALSAKLYRSLMTLHAALNRIAPYDKAAFDALNETLDAAVRGRNYYAPDDCEDLAEILSESFDKAAIQEKIAATKKNHPPHLKHDPVELTDAYLAVIDDAERYVDEHLTYRGMGSCHMAWSLKAEFLKKHGITWHSPSTLNPGVMFD